MDLRDTSNSLYIRVLANGNGKCLNSYRKVEIVDSLV